ncbi:MAG: TetR/AcrR family transcriptional regulator [Subtercola sp.]|nr:TetR/AcrR family transcriptional regulator [Subtercola sp.]
MATDTITAKEPRAERQDARRNRELVLHAAAKAFATDANPTLESIAKSAGVGIGTLYRNFATREELVEAVYRTELERLCLSVDGLLEATPPDVALRSWMVSYSDFVMTKHGMADALRAVIATGAVTSAQTRAALTAAIQTMLDAGAADDTLRADVRAEDVSASLAGIFIVAGSPDNREQALRMLDLLVDGVRAH